jgi:hypothetical protein
LSAHVRSEGVELVQLAALTDALVRSGPRGPAVIAADRLAGALLAFSRQRNATPAGEQVTQAREALRMRAEAQLLGRRLRLGPVRPAPVFTWRVSRLVAVDT